MSSNLWNIAINDPLTGDESGLADPEWYTADGSTTSPVSTYIYDAYNLLFSTELSGWESSPGVNPYTLGDTIADVGGDATIGVGIDLVKTPGALTKFFGETAGSAAYNALTSAWNTTNLTNAGAIDFNIDADQSEAAFKYYESLKEGSINSLFFVGVPGDPLPDSTARLAILDLQYNSNVLGYKNGLPESPHLLADLASGNEADAWFQIAFNSNDYTGTGQPGGTSLPGNAARRWEDAALIGLYNNSDTGQAALNDDLSIYAMLSDNTSGYSETNRTFAFNYSYYFETNIQGVSSNSTGNTFSLTNNNINAQLAVEGLQLLQTGDLEANLKQAATTLIQAYVLSSAQNPFADESLYSANTFDPLDVQVATAKGGNNLVTSTRNGYQLGTGSSLPSLLIAQGGNDTLDATASTSNNVLIGGTGDDTILGGTGNDYIVAGSGNDWIVLQGGNDTVVLGAGDFGSSDGSIHAGNDTLDATNDSSAFTCYVGAGTQETIDLGSGSPTIYLVSTGAGSGPLQTTLAVTAQWIAPGEWYDSVNDALVLEQPGSSGQLNLNAATKNIEVIYGGSSGASSQTSQRLSLSQLEKVYAAEASGTSSSSLTTEITLDNFSGSDDDGIDLGSEPTGPTVSGSSNLSQLKYDGLIGDTTPGGNAQYVYENDASTGVVSAIYGANSTGSSFGNEIQGDGNASYVSAGNGNNTVLLGYFFNHATDPTATALTATVLGGSGNQDLIGVGNGSETIIGGALGSDTTATTFIDGGGATADLVGGGQNSVIFGGTGADTLVASESDGTSGSGFNPTSVLMAGISFWGDAYSSVSGSSGGDYDVGSLPEVSWSGSPANVQVDLSLFQTNDTYGTPFNLLGSSYDSGATGSTTLPGSLLIGGTGHDVLIGNSGNDTIIGGNPTDTVSGTTDEILIGGAGANLIYGGNGTEIIYADMGPGDVSGWASLDASDSDTVYGGDGQDVIYGSGGNDYIYGGSGIDQIYVGNGSSYVDAGSGTSSVYGGTGNDTIVAGGTSDYIETGDGNSSVSLSAGEATISTGAGNDTIDADSGGGTALITEGKGAATIMAGASTGSDTVQLGSGGTTIQLDSELDETTLVVRDVGGDLVLSDGGSMQLTLQGYFASGGNVSLQFSDGMTWGAAQILQASITPSDDGADDTLVGSNGSDSITAGYGNTLIVGVSGNNTLTGGEAADTIDGGSGADTIEGGSVTTVVNGGTGTETYVYNLGDGSDTIFENTTAAGSDTITFGEGISASDLSFVYDSSTNVALITATSTGETILVSNFVATQANQHQIAALDFADGSSLSQLQVIQQAWAIYGTTGNDSLVGTSSANYFDGKGGDDIEVGNGGNDSFVFNSGYGDLEINESYTSGQTPVLLLGAGIAASSLHISANGYNVILTDGVAGDQITLDGMLSASTNGVALVQFADGTTLSAAQILQDLLTGTTGNDTLYGTTGADLFDGKGGNDVEIGNGGNDTFVFNQGYGQLEINESYQSGQVPVLQLGSGITASSLYVTTNGTDIYLTDGTSGDQIKLDGMWSSSTSGVAEVELADGTTLTPAQLVQMEVSGGTTGNDTIYGTSGADLIDGKGGNDLDIGGGGSDTFVFNAGYGDLEINETYSSGQQPILKLGSGITASAIKVTVSGNNLVLTDGVSGDQITLDNEHLSDNYGVAIVQLADGTTYTAANLAEMSEEITGTTGNDTLDGTSGADLFDGKGGNDLEIGDGGNDTFVFDAGYGQLSIDEGYLNGQQPILQLGAGITASALQVTTDGNNLFLADGVAGDKIDLEDMWSETNTGVAAVQLADGTTLTAAQLIQMGVTTTGTTGNDSLYGSSNAELFDGKGGNDYVDGGGGSDTFVFNAGYGQLNIDEDNDVNGALEGRGTFPNGAVPVLELGAGITLANLKVTVGNNVVLTDGITGDQITLDGEGIYGGYGVAEVQFSDGTTLTAAQLIALGYIGTTGNDYVVGDPNAELIDGKGGNDTVVGGGGQDTFVFDAGYGQLNITETSSGNAVLELGSGITASSLRVTTESASTYPQNTFGNVYITDGISGDEITLKNMWDVGTGIGSVPEVSPRFHAGNPICSSTS